MSDKFHIDPYQVEAVRLRAVLKRILEPEVLNGTVDYKELGKIIVDAHRALSETEWVESV